MSVLVYFAMDLVMAFLAETFEVAPTQGDRWIIDIDVVQGNPMVHQPARTTTSVAGVILRQKEGLSALPPRGGMIELFALGCPGWHDSPPVVMEEKRKISTAREGQTTSPAMLIIILDSGFSR